MKLYLPIAQVTAVTPLMLKHGTGEDAGLEPATSITFRAEVDPKLLDELREGLADRFFEPVNGKGPRVLSVPEFEGAFGWKTEYEGSNLVLNLEDCDDLDFDDEELVLAGVDAKGITFEPLAKGMVDFKVNAIVRSDDPELRGKLNGILRHTVKAVFSKLTQKPLAEPKKPKDDGAKDQGKLDLKREPATQH